MTVLNVLVTATASQLCVVPPGNATVEIVNNTVPGGSTPSALAYIGTSNAVTAAAPAVPLPPGSTYAGTDFGPLAALPVFWASVRITSHARCQSA